MTEAELAELRERIASINPHAKQLPCTGSEVPLDFVVGVRGFDLARTIAMEPEFLEDGDHTHDLSVGSVSVSVDGDLKLDAINSALGKLLAERGTDIFRMKGVMAIEGETRRFVFQGVHMLFDGTASAPWGPTEARRSQLVFIGRKLDRGEIARLVESCRA